MLESLTEVKCVTVLHLTAVSCILVLVFFILFTCLLQMCLCIKKEIVK